MTTAPVAIETIHRFAPLGIDFWDILSEAPITDGLVATARVVDSRGPHIPSRRTPAGVHAFMGIPGLRDVEFPKPGTSNDFDLPSGIQVLVDVTVEDLLGRFVSTVVQLSAPKRGLARWSDAIAGCPTLAWSIPEDSPVFLLTAPTREIPSTFATVRAQLVERATGSPAAHAVMRAQIAGRLFWGVADHTGAVALPFPYPAFAGGPAGSMAGSIPAGSHGVPTDSQHWPITIDVRWEPTVLEFPIESEIPRFHSVVCQGSADIWLDAANAGGQNELVTELRYGRELILQTEGSDHSELLIDLTP